MESAMSMSALLGLVFALGCVCGLRSMTAPALVCWATYLGWLNLSDSHLAFLGWLPSVAVFSLLAIGELAADKLPSIPGRNTPGPLAVRFVLGALCGVVLCLAARSPAMGGLVLGGIGGVLGGLAGFWGRRTLKRHFKWPDFPVALAEDILAIASGLFIVSRF